MDIDLDNTLNEYYIVVSNDDKIKLLKIAFGDDYIECIS